MYKHFYNASMRSNLFLMLITFFVKTYHVHRKTSLVLHKQVIDSLEIKLLKTTRFLPQQLAVFILYPVFDNK